MEGNEPGQAKRPRTKRAPRIVRVFTAKDGSLAALEYDNGRAFIFNQGKAPNIATDSDHGYWAEVGYTDKKVDNQT